jgi:hypothetical protein
MRKYFAILAFSLVFAFATFANDCGNHKDHGKGTPSCQNSGGNQGGNGGRGGSGGSSTVNVTNDNLTSVINNIHNSNTNVNSSKSTSNSESNSSSNSSASSNQSQGQLQGQNQVANGGNASADNAGNSQSTSFNQTRQTATAIAPETFPTASCYKTYSSAGQAAGFGFSLGGGNIDKGCEAREDARLLAAMGSKVAACKVLLARPEVSKAGVTMEDCLTSTK